MRYAYDVIPEGCVVRKEELIKRSLIRRILIKSAIRSLLRSTF